MLDADHVDMDIGYGAVVKRDEETEALEATKNVHKGSLPSPMASSAIDAPTDSSKALNGTAHAGDKV